MNKGKIIFMDGGVLSAILGVISGFFRISAASMSFDFNPIFVSDGFLILCIAVMIGTILYGIPFLLKVE